MTGGKEEGQSGEDGGRKVLNQAGYDTDGEMAWRVLEPKRSNERLMQRDMATERGPRKKVEWMDAFVFYCRKGAVSPFGWTSACQKAQQRVQKSVERRN